MNLTYIIGLVFAICVMLFGMISKTINGAMSFDFGQLSNFFDVSSVLIVIGCTIGVVVASFPGKMLGSIPKHFGILLNTKKYKPQTYIGELTELAQIARKNGLLALEEKANEQKDPFFKQAIMLIVDANDPDKVRDILDNDIESMSARHESVAAMYDKASAVAPAFGMVGTLVGLINMLKNMSLDGGGASSLGSDMGTALITTLYGCILAHVIFGPVATGLRTRDEQEVLCKMLIVEGIISIQSGENPKFLKDRLLTYLDQKQRAAEEKNGEKGESAAENTGE
ncbi:MAG: motility protein A [Oscillospiraceae bacterium]|nr:motility protein A [Oscillospiraceae bacterium]